MSDLTPEQVRQFLDYDPATGVLTWRPRPIRPGCERSDKGWNTRLAGKPAGRPDKHGHIYIGLAYRKLYESRNFAAHRLAWVHYYGEWPARGIDHKNGNPSDNRIDNLRLATQTQNLQNARLRSNNTSGIKGVYYAKKESKWAAFITINGKLRAIGRYATKEEAARARLQFSRSHFGEFSNEPDPEAT